VNVILDAPAGTVTVAGTERLAEVEVTESAIPPDPAAPDNETVQDVEEEELSEAGEQVRELMVGEVEPLGGSGLPDVAGWMFPPVAVIGTAVAPRDAPRALLRPIVVADAEEDNENATLAITPSGIRLVLIPEATQVYEDTEPAHEIVLAAELRDEPAVTLIPVTFAGALIVHCKSAGSLPEGEVSERLRGASLPLATVPDESVRRDWPHNG